jgi:hypothetical protein
VGKKQSAQASLEKLSRGLTRETPATRTQETPEQLGRSSNAVEGGGDVTQEVSSPTAKQERPRQRIGRPRTKPERMVRVSVDLPRPDHRFLRDFAYDAESDGMSVMRALLEEMRDDEELAERVLDRLATR